jgi:hypothetical protein
VFIENEHQARRTGETKNGEKIMRYVTHPEHQNAYNAGYTDMRQKIANAGWIACRDEFNLIYPRGYKHASLAGYYYADGELQALSDAA